jgi:hypothetical protein
MKIAWFLMAGLLIVPAAFAQETIPRHEIGLTLGGLFGKQRSGGTTRLNLDSGVALQANYGYRLLGGRTAALYGEVHFLANSLRQVRSSDQTLTRDAATIFLTPESGTCDLPFVLGFERNSFRIAESRRTSPWGAVGRCMSRVRILSMEVQIPPHGL